MLAYAMSGLMRCLAVSLAVVVTAPLGWPRPAAADPSDPAVEERRQPLASPDAEAEYNRGIRARVARDWPAAVSAFQRALAIRSAFPEAWNELGFALRNEGRYAESLDAYGEALRLRPDFPEALEYLGEAYVKLGRIDDARRVLERLRALDAGRAQELAEDIEKGR
jgi:tetratricopeptide (TPR) repeat protein